MHKQSQSGKILEDLLSVLEQYVHPALRSKALSDPRVINAKNYLGSYKKNLSWKQLANGEWIAETHLGVYLIVNELNNFISLQFEDYVLAIVSNEVDKLESLKDQAEIDYIFREHRKAL